MEELAFRQNTYVTIIKNEVWDSIVFDILTGAVDIETKIVTGLSFIVVGKSVKHTLLLTNLLRISVYAEGRDAVCANNLSGKSK